MVNATNTKQLTAAFKDRFGAAPTLLVTSPGRTEIAGNHTDHEGGSVIAGAVDRYVQGVFAPNSDGVARVYSEGYGLTEVDLADLAPREDERATTASLVRGTAALFVERGHATQGFNAYICSDVLGGSGLSSSAAFELEMGQALNALWAKGEFAADTLALMAQRVEREWFGKPCGLMDQASVALGGIQHMNFEDPTKLVANPVSFDFGEAGYDVCIIAVGADHSANTDDYAAVPAEMQAVAREFGENVLSKVSEDKVIAALPHIRKTLGDRAALRALHYYREERLVADRFAALGKGDMDEFCELTRLSGASSAMYLQNVSIGGSADQPSMLAIALAEELLGGLGAVRVHGGGFGGTIQAFVPREKTAAFRAGMDAVFGEGACGVYGIDHEGARYAWM